MIQKYCKLLIILLFLFSNNSYARMHTVLNKQTIYELLHTYEKYYPEQTNQNSVRSQRYSHIINAKSQKYKVDNKLVHAVIKAESGYNPNAVSRAGAVGMMQLMPGTARRFGVSNRRDPEQNIDGGVHYLRFLLDMFKDVKLAVAGYNAGEHNVIAAGYKVPRFAETQNYVKTVLKYLRG